MPHGVPLSADAADVHGGPPGKPPSDRRDPPPDAGYSRELPVGDVPPQPRRADARDGDRRGTGLHVPGLRRRSADADQRRHPPSPRAADGEQPAAHRAAERAADVDAGDADHLLRRRDRDGRQHLSRRPQWRPYADAVDRRSQRRLLESRSGAVVRTADHGPGLRIPGVERRGAGTRAVLAPELDEAADRPAQAVPRLRPRVDRVPAGAEPQGAGVCSQPRRRHDPLRRQSVAQRPADRARSVALQGDDAGRDAGPHGVSPHRRAAVLPDPRRVCLLLVPAAADRGAPSPSASRGRNRPKRTKRPRSSWASRGTRCSKATSER